MPLIEESKSCLLISSVKRVSGPYSKKIKQTESNIDGGGTCEYPLPNLPKCCSNTYGNYPVINIKDRIGEWTGNTCSCYCKTEDHK